VQSEPGIGGCEPRQNPAKGAGLGAKKTGGNPSGHLGRTAGITPSKAEKAALRRKKGAQLNATRNQKGGARAPPHRKMRFEDSARLGMAQRESDGV